MPLHPILDGAPNFVLLGFTMALAAFIRVLSAANQDRLDKLEAGRGSAPLPYNGPDDEVRIAKVEALR